MPRGRHRHSPPLHRLLPPSAIAGVSAVCALGPWVFSEVTVLRVLAAVAAATAVAGAFVMRRWDAQAGKQVADLSRARASDEWRFEERVAELETDLEESRELRTKLEQRLRAKRAELAGLRNEHASLLRRYATAETERATALEGRRLLEIEAAEPSGLPALPPARSAEPEAAGTTEVAEATATTEAAETDATGEEKPGTGAAFSAAGARLFLEAARALSRLDRDGAAADADADDADDEDGSEGVIAAEAAVASGTESESAARSEADAATERSGVQDPDAAPAGSAPETDPAARSEAGTESAPEAKSAPAAKPVTGPAEARKARTAGAEPGGDPGDGPGKRPAPEAAQEGEAQGKPEAAGGHEHAAASSTAPERPARSAGQQPSGHFTVPTAVAVVPAAPVRRPTVEGGFDFFGTQKETSSDALDSVQNEDLADVVGQEALALHKAETEARFKPADEESRVVGQVIDLTAHDETEQIDVQGLRTAAS
ncbi:hypothetical protein [Streptomyces collinus]|uniref:hypothetical protein n=1 Tax=Streptomyces collinus TaxID=42684 RepID=UPI0029421779|nr:hypothetical protein [Streptomyces collinus]